MYTHRYYSATSGFSQPRTDCSSERFAPAMLLLEFVRARLNYYKLAYTQAAPGEQLRKIGEETSKLVQQKVNEGYRAQMDEVNALMNEITSSCPWMDQASIDSLMSVISAAPSVVTASVGLSGPPRQQIMRYMHNYLTAADQAQFQSQDIDISNKVFLIAMRSVKIGLVNATETTWKHVLTVMLGMHPGGLALQGQDKLKLLRELKSHVHQQKNFYLHGPKDIGISELLLLLWLSCCLSCRCGADLHPLLCACTCISLCLFLCFNMTCMYGNMLVCL